MTLVNLEDTMMQTEAPEISIAKKGLAEASNQNPEPSGNSDPNHVEQSSVIKSQMNEFQSKFSRKSKSAHKAELEHLKSGILEKSFNSL